MWKIIWTTVVKYVLKWFIKEKVLKKEDNKKPDVIDPNKAIKDELIKFVADRTNIPTQELLENGIKEIETRDIIPQPEILNKDAKKTLIIVDDIEYTDVLYTNDIAKIKETYNLDINQDYKIVLCVGYYAGYIAYKYFLENKVDVGIFDITLGHQLHVIDTWFMEVDGIDIAYFLKQIHPDSKFILCTAHSLNMYSTTIATYNNKCIRHFKQPLESFYLNKNSDRIEALKNLLYEG